MSSRTTRSPLKTTLYLIVILTELHFEIKASIIEEVHQSTYSPTLLLLLLLLLIIIIIHVVLIWKMKREA